MIGGRLIRKGEDLKIDQQMEKMAEERGLNVNEELESFKDYLEAKGKRYKNYNAAFRNWIRNAHKFGNGKPPATAMRMDIIKTFRMRMRNWVGMSDKQILDTLKTSGLSEAEIKEVLR